MDFRAGSPTAGAGVWVHIAALAGALLIAAPPLLVVYGSRDVERVMEDVTLLSSQETWLRQRGADQIPREPDAWLRPSSKGELRVLKAPLAVWVNMLGWSDLTPEDSTPEQLLARARLIAAGMALMMVAATYGCGAMLGGWRVGLVGAAAMGTMWFFQRQGRTASYDIHMAAWSTLSVAAGWWAMGPLRPVESTLRRRLGWAVCGAAMGLACMSKSAVAAPVVLLPVALAAVLAPGPRWRHAAGIAWGIVVAAAVALPWFLYIRQYDPHLVDRWNHHVTTQGTTTLDLLNAYYYLGLLGLIAPWSIWLVSGMVLPFARHHLLDRRAPWLAWVWFISLFVMFSLVNSRQQRYILPAVPPAAVLVALVFAQHHAAARSGRPDRGAGLLYWPHWIGLIVASLAPAFLVMHPELARRGWFEPLRIATLSWSAARPLIAALLGMALLGLYFSRRHRPLPAAAASVAWLLTLTTVFWAVQDTMRHPDHRFADAARLLRPIVAGHPAYYLRVDPEDHQQIKNCEEFHFYFRRITRPLEPAQLPAKLGDQPLFVLARLRDEHESLMKQSGLSIAVVQVSLDRGNDPRRVYRLWRWPGRSPSAVP